MVVRLCSKTDANHLQLEPGKEFEMVSGLSQPSSTSSSALARYLEAHSDASSTPSKSPMLGSVYL